MSEGRVITTQGRTGTVVARSGSDLLVRWDDGRTSTVEVERVMALYEVGSGAYGAPMPV